MWESIILIQYFDIFSSFWCQSHRLKLYLRYKKSKMIQNDSIFGHFIIFLILFNFFILKSCSSKRVKVLKDNNWTIVWIFFIILWFQTLAFATYTFAYAFFQQAYFRVKNCDLILSGFWDIILSPTRNCGIFKFTAYAISHTIWAKIWSNFG